MYIKFLPNEYVLRYRNGKLVKQGPGLSFFYFEKNTAACAVPITNMDADFIFEETTSDYQTLSVQGQITYRVTDYLKIADALDYSVNLKTKQLNSTPNAKLSKRIINLSDVLLKNYIDSMTLTEALRSGRSLAEKALEQLKQSDELKALGVAVTGFSILQIAATKETARALEAETREKILRQSDDALYERRNASIEQERKVKENELSTEISVEEKKKVIKQAEIQTKQMVLIKDAELEKIKVESAAERERIRIEGEAQRNKIKIEADIELERKRKELAQLQYENAVKAADAEAYRIGSVLNAYAQLSPEIIVALASLDMEPEKMIAQAFEKLAAGNSNIGTLNITPDLLESLTKR